MNRSTYLHSSARDIEAQRWVEGREVFGDAEFRQGVDPRILGLDLGAGDFTQVAICQGGKVVEVMDFDAFTTERLRQDILIAQMNTRGFAWFGLKAWLQRGLRHGR